MSRTHETPCPAAAAIAGFVQALLHLPPRSRLSFNQPYRF